MFYLNIQNYFFLPQVNVILKAKYHYVQILFTEPIIQQFPVNNYKTKVNLLSSLNVSDKTTLLLRFNYQPTSK